MVLKLRITCKQKCDRNVNYGSRKAPRSVSKVEIIGDFHVAFRRFQSES